MILKHIEACILVADFEKCFDSIDILSVNKVLEYFNFGPQIRKWIALLFCEFNLAILSYGYTSKYFPLNRGLLQGNPIASFLFLLTGQVLNDRISQNEKNKGVVINGLK